MVSSSDVEMSLRSKGEKIADRVGKKFTLQSSKGFSLSRVQGVPEVSTDDLVHPRSADLSWNMKVLSKGIPAWSSELVPADANPLASELDPVPAQMVPSFFTPYPFSQVSLCLHACPLPS